jgi:hypothetical protein
VWGFQSRELLQGFVVGEGFAACGVVQRFLGHFTIEEEAARAFDKQSIRLKGRDAAKLNFPITDYKVEELINAPQAPQEASEPSAGEDIPLHHSHTALALQNAIVM